MSRAPAHTNSGEGLRLLGVVLLWMARCVISALVAFLVLGVAILGGTLAVGAIITCVALRVAYDTLALPVRVWRTERRAPLPEEHASPSWPEHLVAEDLEYQCGHVPRPGPWPSPPAEGAGTHYLRNPV